MIQNTSSDIPRSWLLSLLLIYSRIFLHHIVACYMKDISVNFMQTLLHIARLRYCVRDLETYGFAPGSLSFSLPKYVGCNIPVELHCLQFYNVIVAVPLTMEIFIFFFLVKHLQKNKNISSHFSLNTSGFEHCCRTAGVSFSGRKALSEELQVII